MKTKNHQILPSALAGIVLTGALSLARSAQANSWIPSASMSTGRYVHSATLLPNGQVLVAGGFRSGDVTSSAELYDPATGTWTPTASMTTARGAHTATLLPNGKVLVAGGNGAGFTYLSSTELYDPATGTWMATGS